MNKLLEIIKAIKGLFVLVFCGEVIIKLIELFAFTFIGKIALSILLLSLMQVMLETAIKNKGGKQ